MTVAQLQTPERMSVPEARQQARAARNRRWITACGMLVFIVGLSYLELVPLLHLQWEAIRDNLAGYRLAFNDSDYWPSVRTTLVLSFGALGLALVLGTALAWAATRLPRRLQLLRVIPMLPIVVPPVASAVGWIFLLSPGPGYLNTALRHLPWWSGSQSGPFDVYTILWIVLLTGASLSAFVYVFVLAGMQGISAELLEASGVAGSRPFGTFLRVVLPLLRPVLFFSAVVTFLLALGQFTYVLLLGSGSNIDVLSTKMFGYMANYPFEYGAAAAFGTPLLVCGIGLIIIQRMIIGDQRRYVTHGGKAFRQPAGTSLFGAIAISLYGIVMVVLPCLALAAVAFSPYWSGSISLDAFTTDKVRSVLSRPDFLDALRTTLIASLGAVVVTLVLGFVAARILVTTARYFRAARTVLDFMVTVPLCTPAVLFGAGFLITYSQGPLVLYGSRWVFILVYVTLMLPYATRIQLSGMMALGSAYLDASSMAGAGPIQTNVRVVLPLIRSSMAGAGALMFILLSQEFSASLLVRSSQTQTLGTLLYDYYQNGLYPEQASIALVMVGVTCVGVVVAFVVGGADILSKV